MCVLRISGLSRYALDAGDKSSNGVLEAWAHEARRIFRDKLTDDDARSKFDEILKAALYADWNSKAAEAAAGTFFTTECATLGAPGVALPRFGRRLVPRAEDDWAQSVEKAALAFSRESGGRDLDLVITRELIDLSAACERVLSAPAGSLLLAGRSGVGRRSAVSVAAASLRAILLPLHMGKGYGLKQFRNELKAAMQVAGVEGEQVLLLLEDHNVADDPRYLDMINSVLSSGEVPGLYSTEELEPLLTPLKERATNEGYSGGNLLSFFARSVYRNLHVVLVMDCTSKSFVQNCESNPALYKECQVVWRERWSESTMLALPKAMLAQAAEDGDEEKGGKKSSHQQKTTSIGDEMARAFFKIYSEVRGSGKNKGLSHGSCSCDVSMRESPSLGRPSCSSFFF